MISINLEREPSSYGMSSWRDLDQAPDHIFGSCLILQVLKSYWIHRDHPDSPASAASTYNTSSQSERIAAAARRSLTRAEYFSRRVLDASSSGNFDSPVEAVVVGGEYAMAVSVGTPPRQFILNIDTGSDLVWLNCEPCIQCIVNATDKPFDPTQSTSYQQASCTDAACTVPCKIPFWGQFFNLSHSQNSRRVLKELVADLRLHFTYPTGLNPWSSTQIVCCAVVCLYQGFPSQLTSCAGTGACGYIYPYGEGVYSSYTSGVVAYETFTFTAIDESSFAVGNVTFGCGQNETLNGFPGVDGLVGLGRGSFSLPSQLSLVSGFTDIFSYCLIPFDGTASNHSTFYFGVPETNISTYTPIYSNVVSPLATYYYVNVTGISVGGVLLNIPADFFDISPTDGSGGVIFDSGTTYTLLIGVAYELVLQVSHVMIIRFIVSTTDIINFLVAISRPSHSQLQTDSKNNWKSPKKETTIWLICVAIIRPAVGQ